LGTSVGVQSAAELDESHESVVVVVVVAGVESVLESVVDSVVESVVEPVVESVDGELSDDVVESVLSLELLLGSATLDALVDSLELDELESAALADWAASIATSTATSRARMAVVVRAKRMVFPRVGVVPHLERTTGRPDRTDPISPRFQQDFDAIRERPAGGTNPTASLQSRVAMRISVEQQRELYRQHAAEAAARLVDVLRARLDELVDLGFERAFDTVGVHEYGDSTYWKSTEQLDEEAAAELADAIFYLHIPVAREHGDLPAAR
jgi:hypothetical protein